MRFTAVSSLPVALTAMLALQIAFAGQAASDTTKPSDAAAGAMLWKKETNN